MPPGVYFNGTFTFTAWVNLRSYRSFGRLFDFSNGNVANEVTVSLTDPYHNNLFFAVYDANTWMEIYMMQNAVVSTFSLNYNTWFYLTAVCDGTQILLYHNGVLIARKIGTTTVSGVQRAYNYIGKAMYPAGDDVDGVFDEIRIYNRALKQSEIQFLMQI